MNELSILRQLGKHPNIVNVYDMFVTNNRGYAVMERARCDVFSMVTSAGSIKKYAGMFCKDIVCGLNHLHKLRVVHGDIKLENMLFFAVLWPVAVV